MQTYNPRNAIAGSMMQRGGGGYGGWQRGMQGASGSPQAGIFGRGRPPGLGGNMPINSQAPFAIPPSSAAPGTSGWNPMAGVNGNWGGGTGMIGAMPPTTAPTPPPVPMATPTPTSSLGQPAAPPLGGFGQLDPMQIQQVQARARPPTSPMAPDLTGSMATAGLQAPLRFGQGAPDQDAPPSWGGFGAG